MKIKDAKGYAMLTENIERFGDETVRVFNGSRKVHEGPASEFIEKHAADIKWTLCASVDMGDDGVPTIVF